MAGTPPPTLLLVEDNRADLFLFEEALRIQGIPFRLLHFWNGEDAIAYLGNGAAHSGLPSLIVIDLHLPGISGGEVLREIRRQPSLSGVPISIISGAPPEQVATLDLAGADAFIHKSIQVSDYLASIGNTVRELCREALTPQR